MVAVGNLEAIRRVGEGLTKHFRERQTGHIGFARRRVQQLGRRPWFWNLIRLTSGRWWRRPASPVCEARSRGALAAGEQQVLGTRGGDTLQVFGHARRLLGP